MTTGANDSSPAAPDKTPAQSPDADSILSRLGNLANANEPANDINRQSTRVRHQHARRIEHAPHLARATSHECRAALGLFIVSAWSVLQELANCYCCWQDEDDDEDRYIGHGHDVNCSDEEVSMAREQQQHRQQHQQHRQQHQQQQHEHLASSSPMKSMRCTRATPAATAATSADTAATPGAAATSGHQLVGQPLMALLIGLLLLNFRLAAGK